MLDAESNRFSQKHSHSGDIESFALFVCNNSCFKTNCKCELTRSMHNLHLSPKCLFYWFSSTNCFTSLYLTLERTICSYPHAAYHTLLYYESCNTLPRTSKFQITINFFGNIQNKQNKVYHKAQKKIIVKKAFF